MSMLSFVAQLHKDNKCFNLYHIIVLFSNINENLFFKELPSF